MHDLRVHDPRKRRPVLEWLGDRAVAAAAMRLPFVKMQALGNDFAIIDADLWPVVDGPLARRLCDRHRGIGADGVLVVDGSPRQPRMRVINADGSQPEMCGNGLCCVAKWLGDGPLRASDTLQISTGAGLLRCDLGRDEHGKVVQVTVNMGQPTFDPRLIPVLAEAPLVCAPFEIDGVIIELTALAIGNPHAVTFSPLSAELVRRLGPLLSAHPRFTAQVNAEFARIVAHPAGPTVEVAVFERGCGWTQACGTGATATILAGVRLGLLPQGPEIPIQLPGGWLHIAVNAAGEATMRGSATYVFEGFMDPHALIVA